jgi:hypothetical protein
MNGKDWRKGRGAGIRCSNGETWRDLVGSMGPGICCFGSNHALLMRLKENWMQILGGSSTGLWAQRTDDCKKKKYCYFWIHLFIWWRVLCVLPSLLPYELLAEMPEVMRGAAILGVVQESWEVGLELHFITLFMLISVWWNEKFPAK